ncbi:MAG: hypothetical protein J6Y70_00210 [Bacilli bacterium]|nr:hypothetical protein [Bacilli bacterium]
MYFSIAGYVKNIANDFIVLENNEIGYKIFVSHPEIFKIGRKEQIFTYSTINQTEQQLIGFKTLEEKEFFLILISTKGIGTKKALHILNKIDYDKISELSKKNSGAFFNEIKNIKTKNIENVINKFKKQQINKNNEKYKKILLALKNFGFKIKDIKPFLTEKIINSEENENDITKQILQRLNKFNNDRTR